MRNRAGITERFPTGTDEVVYSNVTKTECGRGCGLGSGRVPVGGYACLFSGNVSDKEEFSGAKKFNRDLSEKILKKSPGCSIILCEEKNRSGHFRPKKNKIQEFNRRFRFLLR
jgi:hypothetical protein